MPCWPGRAGEAQERTPKENNDEETQFRLQQWTPCSNGDTLDAGDVQANEKIMLWDRGDDRQSGVAPVLHGGVTLWQVARWMGALDDVDMCDQDVVFMKLLGMASTATAGRGAEYCGCVVVERSESGEA